MDTCLQFGILGPLEVRVGGRLVHVGGPRQRALLGLLLCHANQVVSRDQLIEELLAGQPAGAAVRLLRVQISRLRQALADGDGPPRVVARPPGYLLRVELGELDLEVFEQQVAAGRDALARGDPGRAAVLLGEAESLWRGRPLADLEFEPFARFEIQRLAELRLLAAEDRIEAGLALGQHSALCPELGRLVAEHPLRERLRGQLMLALYRSGRQADALETYRSGRLLLVEELGIEPGPGLRRVHEQVLAADPLLELPAPAVVLAGRPVSVPRELPADVAGFTGRAVELAELDLLLTDGAGGQPGGVPGPVLISAVSGTAGVGKTALAVRWAHRVAGEFPDGQLYVNLRGYDPGQPVPAADALAGFLRAMGVPGPDIPLEEGERAAWYRSAVAGKRLLVVLDNAATAEQVRPMLPGTRSVLVVVTSRDALAGLVARDGARRLDLDLLPTSDAVALLTALVGGRAEADPAAAETLAGLCARLPLALRVAAELAVARPDTLLADLVTDLAGQEKRLGLLDAGGDPHGAVASVFSWSYRHLPTDAARMFRLLGLHPSPDWDRYAAAALAGTSPAQASGLLNLLARAHLAQPAGPDRYQMHDLLRAYAASLAVASDEGQVGRAALTRLFDYYLAACATAMDRLVPAEREHWPDLSATGTVVPEFGDRAGARAWLDAELPTLTAVAAHTVGHGWPGHTTRLAAIVRRYLVAGHYAEGLIIHGHALTAARDSGDLAAEARALLGLGELHRRQGRYQQAADCHQKALAIGRDTGDVHTQAKAVGALGTVYRWQGRYQQAADCDRQSLALYRELGDLHGQAWVLLGLGSDTFPQGRYRQAAEYDRQAAALFRQAGDLGGEAYALSNLGETCYRRGQYDQAVDYLQQALAADRELNDRTIAAEALTRLGEVCCRQGDYERAVGLHQQALALFREIGSRDGEADALNGTGESLLAASQPSQARDCHTAALTLTRQTGNRREQARTLARLGQVSHHQGVFDQAADYSQQALALYQEIGDRGGEADALNGSGETLLATGRPGQARDRHAEALTLAQQTGDRYQQARAHQGLAAACHATGQLDQASQHWQHARGIFTHLGVPEGSLMPGQPPDLNRGPATSHSDAPSRSP